MHTVVGDGGGRGHVSHCFIVEPGGVLVGAGDDLLPQHMAAFGVLLDRDEVPGAVVVAAERPVLRQRRRLVGVVGAQDVTPG